MYICTSHKFPSTIYSANFKLNVSAKRIWSLLDLNKNFTTQYCQIHYNKPKMLSFLKPVTVRSVCIKSKFWLLTLKLDGYKPFGNWYVDGILEGGLPNTMAI